MSVTPSSPDVIIPKLKAETLSSIIKKGVRPDGRGLEDFRQIEIITNYLPKAEGSALVKLGETQVLVGVKLDVGTPYSDAPDEGVIVVSAEFVPTASPAFEPGPPDENAIELARVVDRVIRECRAIDLSQLVLIPGKKVWTVWIDIYVLDHDGNLIDASAIATLAALLTTKMPKAEVTGDQVVVDKSAYVGTLPISRKALTVTLGKINDALLVDPTLEEESVISSKLIVGVTEDGLIAGLQKSGMGFMDVNEVGKALDIALRKGLELISKVQEAIKEHTNTSNSENKVREENVSDESK
ncbi:MAG: hypothetical protein B7O98_07300 [Zestosphaera tikiterensis]|uniref:Exosome complex component Rrp42 n=1 Tax=Zestosphaera tikiterensis TaxID=1973259 RepID=A0A2R7Y4K0_9CREN|nr:MAG: hypothetical protein B7O98_07300 [Zestosphaera tikiterensis]